MIPMFIESYRDWLKKNVDHISLNPNGSYWKLFDDYHSYEDLKELLSKKTYILTGYIKVKNILSLTGK